MTYYRLGVLGHPLSHTLSPVIQGHFLASAGLEGRYEKFDVPPEALDAWWNELEQSDIRGFNVTIPHKTAMLEKVASLSDTAALIGAVNTVVRTDNGWHGESTDVAGFLAPFNEALKAAITNQHVLILGAGGASRAVAYGLLTLGVSGLVFQVRSPERAVTTLAAVEQMNTSLRQQEASIAVCAEGDLLSMADYAAVINTTPVGMHPEVEASPLPLATLATLPPKALVYDLIYNPGETQLLNDAKTLGLKTQSGLTMLVYQGAASFRHWTGQTLTPETLHKAESLCKTQLTKAP